MFGAYFKRAREEAGLSPAQMAAEIGYRSADMVYKIERDAASPDWEQADKWALACKKLLGDILPNSGVSSLDEIFQPLLAALAGLDDVEIAEQVLILASQARLTRNAITRRFGRGTNVTPTESVPLYNSAQQFNSNSTAPAASARGIVGATNGRHAEAAEGKTDKETERVGRGDRGKRSGYDVETQRVGRGKGDAKH